MSIQPMFPVTARSAPSPSPPEPPHPAPAVGAAPAAAPAPDAGDARTRASERLGPGRRADDARPGGSAETPRRSRRTPERLSLEEATIRAVAIAATQRRRLAREVRDLPPPLDTRLALLASVAEIRTAIVPPTLTTLDRRR